MADSDVRRLLVAAAIVTVIFGIWRALAEQTTSTTTQTTVPSATLRPSAQSGASTLPTPSPTSTITTEVKTTGSDTLELGLLGAAALFGLIAAFYTRLQKVTLPGGGGFELSTPDAQKLTDKVAAGIKKGLPDKPLAERTSIRGARRAFSYMASPDTDLQADVTVEQSAAEAGTAAVLATRAAQDLLRLAGDPDLLRVRAVALGIDEPSDIAALVRGEITDHVSDVLADRALQVVARGRTDGI